MPKYKLTFYRTTNEHAYKTVEADNEEKASEIATAILDSIGELDWTVDEGTSEFDVDEAVDIRDKTYIQEVKDAT